MQNRFKSMRQLYQTAYDIQDACNPIAVSHVLADACSFLSTCDENKTGHAFIEGHPAVRALIDKMCHLCGIQWDYLKHVEKAHDEVMEYLKANPEKKEVEACALPA